MTSSAINLKPEKEKNGRKTELRLTDRRMSHVICVNGIYWDNVGTQQFSGLDVFRHFNAEMLHIIF